MKTISFSSQANSENISWNFVGIYWAQSLTCGIDRQIINFWLPVNQDGCFGVRVNRLWDFVIETDGVLHMALLQMSAVKDYYSTNYKSKLNLCFTEFILAQKAL